VSADGRRTPTISILCPVYRTEPFLRAAIDSVLAQTRDDWELVVVDNGLSDEVVDIVGSVGPDPRIVLVRQENRGLDGGVTAARAAASGRYLLPLCSDDMLVPSTCERFVDVLDARPEIDVVSSDAYLYDEQRRCYLPQSWLRFADAPAADPDHRVGLLEVVGGRDVYYGSAFRREVWDAEGGYADGNASDLGLWLRVLRAERDVRVLPERLGVCRVREGSITTDPVSSGFTELVEGLFEAAVEGSPDPRLRDALDRRLRRRRYTVSLASARQALRRGDTETARARARSALSYRVTPRSVGVLAAVTVAPTLVRRLHPYKQDVQLVLARMRRRAIRASGSGADANRA
jgi:glycosyltransferase involved in cell wall biosynthesis